MKNCIKRTKLFLICCILALMIILVFKCVSSHFDSVELVMSNHSGKPIYLYKLKIDGKLLMDDPIVIRSFDKKMGIFITRIGSFPVFEKSEIEFIYKNEYKTIEKSFKCIVKNIPMYPCVINSKFQESGVNNCYCDHVEM